MPESFSHDELMHLTYLLTRELRGQTNKDHKLFWAWCGEIAAYFSNRDLLNKSHLLKDYQWVNAFELVIHSCLATIRRRVPFDLNEYLQSKKEESIHFNSHLEAMETSKRLLIASLAFAVLEGILRRKNNLYVNKDGTVVKPFKIIDSKNKPHQYGGKGLKGLNRIHHALWLFEQCTIKYRKKQCIGLNDMKREIVQLYSASDPYDLIDGWRNQMLHGNEFWQDRVPVIVNLICMLMIDEIEASLYDKALPNILQQVRGNIQRDEIYRRSIGDFYPPDLP